MSKKVLVALDAPDPDNLVLMRMAQNLFGEENILGALLTGRPIRFDASKNTSLEDWDYDHSRVALQASAARLKNFLRGYNAEIDVYDGGIAPRTLVPHHIHFQDYYRFLDIDPLKAICVSELEGLDKLGSIIESQKFTVLVGGPMTGLANLLQRFPSVAENIESVHAMYATLGNVKLMNFGDPKRGSKQFNVSCDPFSGKYALDSLECPVYFITSECTRNDLIGFETPGLLRQCLEDTTGNRNLIALYNIWFANAVEPRKESIYIHDACAAISASEFGEEVYAFEKMAVKSFPCLPKEKDGWGTIEFAPDKNSNLYVSTNLKSPEKYLKALNEYLR